MGMLTEEEIEALAEPIIEALKQIKDEMGGEMPQLPQVRLMAETPEGKLKVGDIEIDEESLKQIEDYIQEYIEAEYSPTILH